MSDTAVMERGGMALGGLSTSQMCAATGLTYRQLDYMSRCGVIEPAFSRASGSGSVRRWAPEQLRLVRLAAVLTAHGAGTPTMQSALRAAAGLAEEAWGTRVLVTLEGRVTTLLGADTDGWMVDLAACHHGNRMAA